MTGNNALLGGLAPVHPGAFLREDVLPHVKIPKTGIADALGISRAQLYAILGEKAPVTAAMALRLGKLFGNGPELWLNMQSNYDIETLGPKMKKELAAIRRVKAAA
jgi:addiction module HigA family antidote